MRPATVCVVVRQRIEYASPLDRPPVEVLVDGAWCYGLVRMQIQHDDGGWEINVQWTPGLGQSWFIDSFTPDHVRADTVDRRRGR